MINTSPFANWYVDPNGYWEQFYRYPTEYKNTLYPAPTVERIIKIEDVDPVVVIVEMLRKKGITDENLILRLLCKD